MTNKYKFNDIVKVYHDADEVDSWPTELVKEIKESQQYKDYCKQMDKLLFEQEEEFVERQNKLESQLEKNYQILNQIKK